MERFEIWDAERQWQGCPDRRPWLIVDERQGGKYGGFPISGSSYEQASFEIREDHPDFEATGLTKGCFVHDVHIYDLSEEEFVKVRGRLSGDLLRLFREYAGL